jgi:hypothetical protein
MAVSKVVSMDVWKVDVKVEISVVVKVEMSDLSWVE